MVGRSRPIRALPRRCPSRGEAGADPVKGRSRRRAPRQRPVRATIAVDGRDGEEEVTGRSHSRLGMPPATTRHIQRPPLGLCAAALVVKMASTCRWTGILLPHAAGRRARGMTTMAEGETDATRDEPAPDPLIGTVVNGRFHIVKRIARGGMGSVYFATQAPLSRPVAV